MNNGHDMHVISGSKGQFSAFGMGANGVSDFHEKLIFPKFYFCILTCYLRVERDGKQLHLLNSFDSRGHSNKPYCNYRLSYVQ